MTGHYWTIALSIAMVGCGRASTVATGPNPTPVTARYTITTLDNFRGARVRACFDGGPVHELIPIRAGDTRHLRAAWRGDEALDIDEGRIPLEGSAGTECIVYLTRFERSWMQPAGGSAIVISQAQWLWRPNSFPVGLDATAEFLLPAGAKVSTPWPKRAGAYVLDESAFFTDAYVVFGKFDERSMSLGDTAVEVAQLGADPPHAEIRRLLDRSLRAAASIGPFPRERVHFVVAPVETRADSVVFGMLRRGGGASILLVPSVNASREGLDRDWVVVHELSHLWLPRFYPRDRWLSEGIATYLQEVLRARCGLQSPALAWERLFAGFERGRRSGTGRSLVAESRDMDRTGAYQRVYWAGAAFALEADVHLRAVSGGEDSLLSALSTAQRAWGDSARPVTSSVFIQALDHSGFLGKLGEKYGASNRFPSTGFIRGTKARALRAEIMAGEEETCGFSGESQR